MIHRRSRHFEEEDQKETYVTMHLHQDGGHVYKERSRIIVRA